MYENFGSCDDEPLLIDHFFIHTTDHMQELTRNASIMLHHDAITGTAWEKVINDYLLRIETNI